jgi:hypothetical protein
VEAESASHLKEYLKGVRAGSAEMQSIVEAVQTGAKAIYEKTVAGKRRTSAR